MFMVHFYLFIFIVFFLAEILHISSDICCCLFLSAYFFVLFLVVLLDFCGEFVWFLEISRASLCLIHVFMIDFKACWLCWLLYFALCLDILCLFRLLSLSYFDLFVDNLLIVIFVRLLINDKTYFLRIKVLSYLLLLCFVEICLYLFLNFMRLVHNLFSNFLKFVAVCYFLTSHYFIFFVLILFCKIL